ncbi:MAG: hypothetical protein J5601_06295 [Elusimicrobiaceae bacterium]|nr:hypothetical protein [Elusimicrobiaceae bacterium]
MKNKWMIALLACAVCLPAFAAEETVVPADERPAVEAQRGPRPDVMERGEFQKAQKEHRAKMKATEEKMEKLVKEYQKLKGKKQEAKKAEIAAEITQIREEQLKFKQAQLDKFAKRLEEMKKHISDEQTVEAKKAWIDKKTDELIETKGDLKVLFDREGRPGMKGLQGPNGCPKIDGTCTMHKPPKGVKGGKGSHKGPRVGLLPPPPPPPLEEK